MNDAASLTPPKQLLDPMRAALRERNLLYRTKQTLLVVTVVLEGSIPQKGFDGSGTVELLPSLQVPESMWSRRGGAAGPVSGRYLARAPVAMEREDEAGISPQ